MRSSSPSAGVFVSRPTTSNIAYGTSHLLSARAITPFISRHSSFPESRQNSQLLSSCTFSASEAEFPPAMIAPILPSSASHEMLNSSPTHRPHKCTLLYRILRIHLLLHLPPNVLPRAFKLLQSNSRYIKLSTAYPRPKPTFKRAKCDCDSTWIQAPCRWLNTCPLTKPIDEPSRIDLGNSAKLRSDFSQRLCCRGSRRIASDDSSSASHVVPKTPARAGR